MRMEKKSLEVKMETKEAMAKENKNENFGLDTE